MRTNFYAAIATLIGAMIGAGILGIPYVFANAGFVTGVIVLFIVALIITYVHLGFGEVILRTKEQHQITGYAEKYLGKIAKRLMTFSSLMIFYFVLSAYLIASGQILFQLFGIPEIIGSIIFFIFFSLIVAFGLKLIEDSELALILLIFMFLILFVTFLFPKIIVANLTTFSFNTILLPYGILMFAFYGVAVIPEMAEELSKSKKQLKKAIITGTAITGIIYILFAAMVVGISATNTTEVAVIGLSNILGPAVLFFGSIFGLIAIFTSALPVSLATKEIFNYDFGLSKRKSLIFATIVPFLFFLLIKQLASFSSILNIVGAVFCTIQLILVLFIIESAKKKGDRKPEYSVYISKPLIYLIIILLVIGAVNVLI